MARKQTPYNQGEANPNARLTLAVVGEIRRMRGDGMTCLQCALKFGVAESTVSRLSANKTWKPEP